MKQTVGLLLALAVVLILATGFIVSTNLDQSRIIDLYKDEVNTLQNQNRKLKKEIANYEAEESASAEAMRKVMEERDTFKRKLSETVVHAQETEKALEQQKRQNEKQLQEKEDLAAEYEDLSQACDALEARILILNDEAAQAAVSYEAQALKDAERIRELEELAAASLISGADQHTDGSSVSYADSEQSVKESSAMMIDIPAQPGEGPAILPTPDISDDNQPAQPGEGPVELPTPEVTPQVNPPQVIPIPQVTLCPLGYSRGIVQNGQTFTDLLLQHNVSWQAMRLANPSLSTTRIAPGTRYCIPPAGSRKLCPSGTDSYVMGQFEDLNTLSELFGVAPGVFLTVNTQLAPGDFTAGRVVCVP